jgi:DNA-binding NarL/FixJ family response regulator
MIKLMMVEDHPIVRRGLRDIISEHADIEVKTEAERGEVALRAFRERGHYDVVLLDIALPDQNGLDVLKQLRALDRQVRVLILSAYPEEQYAIRALRAGAVGYLTKASAPDELVAAIRRVMTGGKYITPSLAERLATEIGPDNVVASHTDLSDREFQVLCMLGGGQTVTEIAEALTLSPKTISTYRTRVLRKLNLETTAQLIHYAVAHGLSEVSSS